jgi:hypothetical protein
LYELAGSNDDGTLVAQKLRTGKLLLGNNKLRVVHVYGKLSGDFLLVIETAEGDRYEYDVEPVSEYEDVVRVKVGKGIRSKYVIMEIQNESDQTITIDKIEGLGMK